MFEFNHSITIIILLTNLFAMLMVSLYMKFLEKRRTRARLLQQMMEVKEYIHNERKLEAQSYIKCYEDIYACLEANQLQEAQQLMTFYIDSLSEATQHVAEVFDGVTHIGLRAMLIQASYKAKNKGIQFEFGSTYIEKTHFENFNSPHCMEVVGILLDNAVESAQNEIIVLICQEENQLILTIENDNSSVMDLKSIGALNVSSKGRYRGLGLWLIGQRIKYAKWMALNTILEEDRFKQVLSLKTKLS